MVARSDTALLNVITPRRVRKFGRDLEAAPAAIGLTSFGPPLSTRRLWGSGRLSISRFGICSR